MKKLFSAILVVAAAVLVIGCGGREVTRTDPDTTTDLSGYWNETDARMVADSMIDQCLGGTWLGDFESMHGGVRGEGIDEPVIVVGGVYNESSEHINTDIFMNEIERAFLESGRIQVAAGGTSRTEIRTEREDQSIFASPETAAQYGREIGADYVMTGDIGSIVDEEGSTRSVYYQISLELVDVETALKVWMGSLEIKKIIEW